VGPNKTPWLTEMMSQVCEVVTKGTPAFVYDSKAQKKWNPNKKRRWLIPVIFAAQVCPLLLSSNIVIIHVPCPFDGNNGLWCQFYSIVCVGGVQDFCV
jgi:hypothetical protein